MATPKTPITIPAKVYEDDALMLDKVSALALLEGWEGDWDGRANAVRGILTNFIDRLPADSRIRLRPTEAPAT